MVEEKVIKNCDGIIQGVSFTSFFICDKVLGFRVTDEILKKVVQKLDHTLKNGFCKQKMEVPLVSSYFFTNEPLSRFHQS